MSTTLTESKTAELKMSAIYETLPVAVAVNVADDETITMPPKPKTKKVVKSAPAPKTLEEMKAERDALDAAIKRAEMETKIADKAEEYKGKIVNMLERRIERKQKQIEDLRAETERRIAELTDEGAEITEEMDKLTAMEGAELKTALATTYKTEVECYIREANPKPVNKVAKAVAKAVGKKDDASVSSLSSAESKKPKVKYDREQQFNELPVGFKMFLSYKGRTANYEKTEMGLRKEGDTTDYDTLHKAAKEFFGADKKTFNAWEEFKTTHNGKRISIAKYVE